jgi:hypothetical protein
MRYQIFTYYTVQKFWWDRRHLMMAVYGRNLWERRVKNNNLDWRREYIIWNKWYINATGCLNTIPKYPFGVTKLRWNWRENATLLGMKLGLQPHIQSLYWVKVPDSTKLLEYCTKDTETERLLESLVEKHDWKTQKVILKWIIEVSLICQCLINHKRIYKI